MHKVSSIKKDQNWCISIYLDLFPYISVFLYLMYPYVYVYVFCLNYFPI